MALLLEPRRRGTCDRLNLELLTVHVGVAFHGRWMRQASGLSDNSVGRTALLPAHSAIFWGFAGGRPVSHAPAGVGSRAGALACRPSHGRAAVAGVGGCAESIASVLGKPVCPRNTLRADSRDAKTERDVSRGAAVVRRRSAGLPRVPERATRRAPEMLSQKPCSPCRTAPTRSKGRASGR